MPRAPRDPEQGQRIHQQFLKDRLSASVGQLIMHDPGAIESVAVQKLLEIAKVATGPDFVMSYSYIEREDSNRFTLFVPAASK